MSSCEGRCPLERALRVTSGRGRVPRQHGCHGAARPCRSAGRRAAASLTGGAEAWVPSEGGVDDLRRAARACQGCELYRDATQTVFGEGDPHARLVLVGEQPGDVEDREGHPFVGPAGRLLFRALAELDLAREDVYVTNAVKHFRFTQRGKRRIHEKPSLSHLTACRPWVEAELERLSPDVVVCLGATAMRAVLGPGGTITERRGRVEDGVLVTIHPSAVLRSTDRDSAYDGLRSDLAVAVQALG